MCGTPTADVDELTMALDLSDCDIIDDVSPSPTDATRSLSDDTMQSNNRLTTTSSDGFILESRRLDRRLTRPAIAAQEVQANDFIAHDSDDETTDVSTRANDGKSHHLTFSNQRVSFNYASLFIG
jgi:hypothetical protein